MDTEITPANDPGTSSHSDSLHSVSPHQPYPITTLPNELLEEIFLQHISIHWNAYEGDMWRPRQKARFYGWLYITHICRHWRNIALSVSDLWSHILLTDVDCVSAFLDRSGQVPLAIYALSHDENPAVTVEDMVSPWPHMLKLIWREIHRISVLQVKLSSSLHTALLELEERDAPALHTLAIWGLSTTNPHHSLSTVLKGPLSQLREISIEGYNVGIIPAQFIDLYLRPTLTRLELGSFLTPIPHGRFLEILRSMPLLTHLALNGTLVNTLTVPFLPPSAEAVTLSHLSSIYLRSPWPDTGISSAALLRQLIIPTSASLILGCSITTSRMEAQYSLSAFSDKALGNGTVGPERAPFVQAGVTYFNNNKLKVVSFSTIATPVEGDANEPRFTAPELAVGVKFHLLVTGPGDPLSGPVQAILTSQFPLQNITVLRCAGFSSRTHTVTWILLFRVLPLLKALVITSSSLSYFLHGLSAWLGSTGNSITMMEDADPSRRQHGVLSSLTTLALHDLSWSREESQAAAWRDFITVFDDWSLRAGRPLDSLVISGPKNLSNGDLQTLQSSNSIGRVIVY